MLYVTVSTGIGGGWVLGGRIWGGADGMAGEIGHVVVRPGGAACVCGKRGCLEAEACGPAIGRAARERLAGGRRQEAGGREQSRPRGGERLMALADGDFEAITAQHVAQAAQEGDSLAQAVLDEAARMLGAGLGGAVGLMNPERVVLGGGVTKSGEHWWRIVRETARAHVLPETRVEIVPAALGDDAPLWGAAVLAESLIVE
jgi:glucokinase